MHPLAQLAVKIDSSENTQKRVKFTHTAHTNAQSLFCNPFFSPLEVFFPLPSCQNSNQRTPALTCSVQRLLLTRSSAPVAFYLVGPGISGLLALTGCVLLFRAVCWGSSKQCFRAQGQDVAGSQPLRPTRSSGSRNWLWAEHQSPA